VKLKRRSSEKESSKECLRELKSVVVAGRAGSTISVEESKSMTTIKSAVERAREAGGIGIDSVEGLSLSSLRSNASGAERTDFVSTIIAGTSTFNVARCWITLLYARSRMTKSNASRGVVSSLSGTGTVKGAVSAKASAKSLKLATVYREIIAKSKYCNHYMKELRL